MNISLFHRDRPRKTYSCIVDLQKYVNERIDFHAKNHTTDNDMCEIKTKLEILKKNFLAGE